MDGVITPDEIRVLEKAYKALGLEAGVFGDLHAMSPTQPSPARKPSTSGFHLDHNRVRELQNETQQVSQLLANIFTDEASAVAPIIAPIEGEETSTTRIFDLDHEHAALAHLLLSRPVWNRNEVADAAANYLA